MTRPPRATSPGAARRESRPVSSPAPIAAALVLLLAGAAAAQQPPQQDDAILRLPPVQLSSPAPDLSPRSATPAHVDRLAPADLSADHPTVLPDALQRLPGVTLQSEQGTPFQPTLTLRGFVASPVTGLPQGLSVFLDGVRLNEPTVEEVNFDLIPLEAVDHAEIIRGPSVIFGRNTLGGAINLVTRRGEEVLDIMPRISAGSFGRLDTRFRLGGTARPFDYFLSFTRTTEDGYRDFTGATVNRVFAKIGIERGGRTSRSPTSGARIPSSRRGRSPRASSRAIPARTSRPETTSSPS